MRLLGASEYGHFVLAESFVFALNVLAIFGTHLSCFALGGGERKAHPRVLLAAGAILILLLWTAECLAGALLWPALPARLRPDPSFVALIACAVPGLCLYRYLSE